jgi:putative FmdB family regulatory protein
MRRMDALPISAPSGLWLRHVSTAPRAPLERNFDMPAYDYECKECGRRFEGRQKMSEEPIAVCPQCGGKAERLISGGAGIIFKGSGFYEPTILRHAPVAAGRVSATASPADPERESKYGGT